MYAALRRRLAAGGHTVGRGDEGGFAPQIAEPETVLDLLVHAITDAGYIPSRARVAIALDPVASEFHDELGYHVAGETLTSTELIDRYEQLMAHFPIWSIEDGLGEDDWHGWSQLTARLGDRVQIVGDDILTTEAATIRRAADDGVANAALVKVNQIGTVSRTLDALQTCRDVGFAAMVSHRSGETPDTFIADLAAASGCGQLKACAPARGERVSKHNRLLQMAASNPALPYGGRSSG